MQVSVNGIDYRIVNGGTKIIDSLPPKVYELNYSQFSGIWLSERRGMEVGNFHIYGNTPKRVEKVFSTFKLRDKNLGILLSGDKGMGKSVFMRYAAERAIEKGFPVIVVSSNLPGLADFIGKIQQECVILFDEFEKNFLKDGDNDGDEQGGQTQFLSLFDGMDNGKKLYLISVNNEHKLSSFFINRPGRFYYHFTFSYLTEDEVRDYAMDNLNSKDEEMIGKLSLIAKFHDVNYDILSAIIAELNNGYGLKETIEDLNIDIGENKKFYDVETVVRGVKLYGESWIDVQDTNECANLRIKGSRWDNICVHFDMTKAVYSKKENGFIIKPNAINNTYLENTFADFKDEDCGGTVEIEQLVLRPHTFDDCQLSYLI